MKKITVALAAFIALNANAQTDTSATTTTTTDTTVILRAPAPATSTSTTTTTTRATTTSVAGESSAKVVYVEGGFPGLLSINYDMRFTPTQDGFGFRAGFGGWSIGESRLIFVPIGLNYITSKNRRDYFEAGAGMTIVSNSKAKDGDDSGPFKSTFGFLSLGYRKQPAEGGFFWKVALVPVFGKGFFFPYTAGAGVGYTF